MKDKVMKKKSKEEYLYHNTELLLRKYRDVVWSIEVSAIQAQISFELEMDCKLEEFWKCLMMPVLIYQAHRYRSK